MTTTQTATQTATRYEVVFGTDEADRQTYIDHHDGSFISSSAHARATSAYVRLIADGVTCGFFVDGVLKSGIDSTAELAEMCEPTVEHKTRTSEGSVATTGGFKHYALDGREVETYGWIAQAFCTCGWSTVADDRSGARRAAKYHRAHPAAQAGRPRGRRPDRDPGDTIMIDYETADHDENGRPICGDEFCPGPQDCTDCANLRQAEWLRHETIDNGNG